MDDPALKPSDPSDAAPTPPARPAHPTPFGSTPVDAAPGVESSETPLPDPDGPVHIDPPPEPAHNFVKLGPPSDHMPGDAAPTPTIPLREETAPAAPPARAGPMRRVGLIDEDSADMVDDDAPPAAIPAPASVRFTLWLLVWLALWSAGMGLLLNHRFDRKMDWNTSYFSTVARNLVRDGFVHLHGGMYLRAGEGFDPKVREFYAGHPPLTAWLLAGWMKAFGTSDAAIRSLPLAFTVLNLILLYALVRRVFGAAAALASTVVCSLLPMTAYYAQVVNMEPFVMTFVLGASVGYVGWSRRGSTIGFLMLCVCVVLGCWTDWPMYVFTGFLALFHVLRRRESLGVDPETGEPRQAPRPIVGSLFLIVLALGMFALFIAYLYLNGSGPGDLLDRARIRQSGGQASRFGGYTLLASRFMTRNDLRDWFVSLFTVPGLMLGSLGALTWVTWSRRLSLAGGEAGRQAAFRILLCLFLTQLVYTLAFPEGAYTHEFWQYYLTVPVAVLVAGFCAWLTVAGGSARGFFPGFLDRCAWAAVAMIPVMAINAFTLRMNLPPGLTKDMPTPGEGLFLDYAQPLREITGPTDVVLTDRTDEDESKAAKGIQRALPWYADRALVTFEGPNADDENDTRSPTGIAKVVARFPGHHAWYLWQEVGPESLFQYLNKNFAHRSAGTAVLYDVGSGPILVAPTSPTPTPPAGTRPAAATTSPTSSTRLAAP